MRVSVCGEKERGEACASGVGRGGENTQLHAIGQLDDLLPFSFCLVRDGDCLLGEKGGRRQFTE